MSNNTLSDPYQESDDTSVGSFGYGLGLSAAVLFVFFFVTFFSYRCQNSQTTPTPTLRRHSSDYGGEGTIHVVIQHQGLDAATISTFPQYTYAQLKPHKSAASGCAVCLGDYKDTETLRLLPECGHVFHRSCIDPWLMTNPTCPICRSSPHLQPAPVANQ